MPVLHLESSPDQFFSDIEVEDVAKRSQQLPVWVGELYLELHQGTLTSQAIIVLNIYMYSILCLLEIKFRNLSTHIFLLNI